MSKKLLLRIFTLAALLSFVVPAFASNSPLDMPNSTQANTLTVTVNQKVGQADPTNGVAIFRVVFSDPIDTTTFDKSDIVLTGTAQSKNVISITEVAPNNGTTFDVSTSAIGSGTIIASIPANTQKAASKILGNENPITASSNSLIKDSSGNFYSSNYSSANITKTTPSGAQTTYGTTGTNPNGIVLDAAGNAYTSNWASFNVSKIEPNGTSTNVSTTSERPTDIAIDTNENLYVSIGNNNTVQKITPAGAITTFASTGAYPYKIITDSSNNIYTLNRTAYNVTKITPSGVATTLGATGTIPSSIDIDNAGNIYVANNGDYTITKITPAGVSSIFATLAYHPTLVRVGDDGNIYSVGQYNISKISAGGVATSVGRETDGSVSGIRVDSNGIISILSTKGFITQYFNSDIGIKDLDGDTNLISTSSDNTITYSKSSITINQKVGQADPSSSTSAKFTVVFPTAIKTNTFDTSDVTLTGSATGKTVNSVVEVSPNNGTTFEVSASGTSSGTIIASINAGHVSYTNAQLASVPMYNGKMVTSAQGNTYIPNPNSFNVTKITSDGAVSTIDTTPAIYASTYGFSIAVDSDENLYTTYLSGPSQFSLQKMTAAGVKTFLGYIGSTPYDVQLDDAGNVYTLNINSTTVSKITPSGITSSLGPTVSYDWSFAVDKSGNSYVSDNSTNQIVKSYPNGDTINFATAENGPNSTVVDTYGNIYTANKVANTVSKITPDGTVSTFATTLPNGPQKLLIDSAGNLYVKYETTNYISKITPSGSISSIFQNAEGADDFSIDPDGNLYSLIYGYYKVNKATRVNTGIVDILGNINEASTSIDNSVSITSNSPNEFVTTWKTDNPGTSNSNQIKISTFVGSIDNGSYNYDVDWGDGSTSTGLHVDSTHSYATPGIYTVKITGLFPRLSLGASNSDSEKILSVEQWGTNQWTSMSQAFLGASNLTINASDAPDLSNVTDMSAMFQDAISLNSNLNNWDTSNVTIMNRMFQGALTFNQALNNWDVSNVTNMDSMFRLATSFNQSLNSWNTGSVSNIDQMFRDAHSFNGDISNWNVSSVTTMSRTFESASAFNKPIDSWNIVNVTDMSYMFSGAQSFNQALNGWDTSNVTNMLEMFAYANSFNQALNNWDVSNVSNMTRMFRSAISFNSSLSNWNLTGTTSIAEMFLYASSFNQNINSWNTSTINNMYRTFGYATNFNQPLNNWDMSNVTTIAHMFIDATSFNQPLNNWNVENVSNMDFLFSGAISYDQSLADWVITSATNLANMFSNDSGLSIANYDATLIAWSTLPLQNNVIMHGGSSTYCDAATERATIISTFNWTISDNGSDCFGNAFITTWKTDNPGTSNSNQITIPISSSFTDIYNYNVDWGDGNISNGLTSGTTHTYLSPGTYTVKINGLFPRINFYNSGDKQKLITVAQWGNNHWTSMARAFYEAINMTVTATDTPDLSGVTDMSEMFSSAISFNTNINNWDVSNVTDMTGVFGTTFTYQTNIFNQPLDNWDVSNVTKMGWMFNGAAQFNQDISNWDVSNVTDMQVMFWGAAAFNQPLNNWDLSNVTTIQGMFISATAFNQPLNNWNTSNVVVMNTVFSGASSFNQNINSWDTSNVTQMAGMFRATTNFNQSLISWNVSNVTRMGSMFDGSAFDQPLNNWNTSNVSDMSFMFYGPSLFDQDISSWDISNVTDMNGMFSSGSGLSTSNYDNTLVAWSNINLQSNVVFDAGASNYCDGASARSDIINIFAWTINDAGTNCSPSTITMHGDGSEHDPYQITSCIELQQISLSPSSSFILLNDIDCSGTSSWNSGQGFEPLNFTGKYFDGRNHAINGLFIFRDEIYVGLFSNIGASSTVKNLNLNSAHVENNYLNASAARSGILAANNEGFINGVRTSGSVNSLGIAGGLIGFNTGSITRSTSSSTVSGDGTGSAIIGGLVGYAAGNISDSFAIGSVTVVSDQSYTYICGGLIGQTSLDGLVVSRTYATGTITCNFSSAFGIGGLIGSAYNGVTLSDSFSSAQVSGSGIYYGGLVGTENSGAIFPNSAYDIHLSGQTTCVSGHPNFCIGVNNGNSSPNYFKNNNTNIPFTNWNFSNIWQQTSEYPLLRDTNLSPAAPTNLTVTADKSSATASWTAPNNDGGSPITDYIVAYKVSSSITWQILDDKINADTNAFIPNLGLDSYDFRVQAINANGYGFWSGTISATLNDTVGTDLDGSGTTDDPYQITNCQKLQLIKNAPAFSYVLTNDIDCSETSNWDGGKGFDPLGIFTGEYFDGRNHTILNLFINRSDYEAVALFSEIGPQSSVKNTTLKGGSMSHALGQGTSSSQLASFVGSLHGELINVHSTINLSANAMSLTGGIAGEVLGGEIQKSSFRGNITVANTASILVGSIGGISGDLVNGYISDSYASSIITATASNTSNFNCGGGSGYSYGSNISRSYFAGSISCPGTNMKTGGLVGHLENTFLSQNFTASTVDRTVAPNATGSLIGISVNSTYDSNYFDSTLSQSSECNHALPAACTGVNDGLTQATYFKSNHSNVPLASWDFTSIWIENASYPILQAETLPPEAPKNLAGINQSTSVNLSWIAPDDNGGSSISDYEIKYRHNGDTDWVEFNDGVSTNTASTVTGLIDGESYDFKVRAINDVGGGLWSATQVQLNVSVEIDVPNATQFEYGQPIEYKVVVDNNSIETFDKFDTDFIPIGFTIDSINVENPTVATPPTDLGSLSNNNTEWNGLLDPNQELVFAVHGTIDGMPNDKGGLSFVASNFEYQGNNVPLGDGSNRELKTNSPRFEILNSQTDFKLETTMQETGVIENGDTIHLKYTISNLGPKTGFFTNSATYIFFPPQLNILSIENDLLICAAPVQISSNLNAGIFSNLIGNAVSLCTAGNSALLQNGDSFDIDVIASANTNFIKDDIVSRGILIAEQDVDNVSINTALSSEESGTSSIFASTINNISTLIYNQENNNNSSSTTTTTTTNPNVTTTTKAEQTPSSNDKTTGSKSNATTPKTKVVNKGQVTSIKTAQNGGITNTGSYEGLPQVKQLLKGVEDANKLNNKNKALAKLDSKEDNSFSLLWLMILVAVVLTVISIKQAQQNAKSKKMYTE